MVVCYHFDVFVSNVLQSLARMPHVRESALFQDFLPFNKGSDMYNSALLSNISISPDEILAGSRMEEGRPSYDNVINANQN